MLLENLSIVMDLPFPQCLKEGSAKLSSTYCIVNGKLEYIVEIREELLVTEIHDINARDVNSFEVFLPPSGVYIHPDGDVYLLIKQPIRQWLKSFSFNFYAIDGLYNCKPRDSGMLVRGIFNAKFVPSGLWWSDKFLHFFKANVGVRNADGSVKVTNELFRQEIEDALRDGVIK